MSSIVQGYDYDIFISYRQKDNRYDGWVSEFVANLKKELDATFKEDLSIYFDINPSDGLLETHLVDRSLEGKLKCLIFIPVISRTYCDPKSYAWKHEFCAFNTLSKTDQFGRDIKLKNGNVTSRVLPVLIHNLDNDDKALLKKELDIELRAIEFIYTEPGVNRPLRSSDNKHDNQNKTDYRNQVNKVANAVKEIIGSMMKPQSSKSNLIGTWVHENKIEKERSSKASPRTKILIGVFSLIIFSMAALAINKYYFSEKDLKSRYNNKITSNPVAYEWYMKAEFRHPSDKRDIDSTIFFLKKAIEADPKFALAYAKLARAYNEKDYWIAPNLKSKEQAYVEAYYSLRLDPDLAEGYLALAQISWTPENKFPHEKAIRGYKKAISLDRDLDDAYAALGVVYDHVGLMKESYQALNKALKINPENRVAPLYLITWRYFTGNKKSLEELVELYKQTPDRQISPLNTSFWAMALITLDRSVEAEKLLSAGLKKDSSDLDINSAFSVLMAKKGNKTDALKRIGYVEKGNLNTGDSHHVVYNLAVAYALLGNYEAAVDKLTWVKDNGFPNYTFFRDDPLLVSLHDYEPYKKLLEKLKISTDNFRRVANE